MSVKDDKSRLGGVSWSMIRASSSVLALIPPRCFAQRQEVMNEIAEVHEASLSMSNHLLSEPLLCVSNAVVVEVHGGI